jgi:hypothetical protein
MGDTSQNDNRWNIRQPLTLGLTVYRDDSRLFTTNTSNISMAGMFIETDSQQLAINDDVSIAFSQDPNNPLPNYRLSMRVVRSTEHGAALVFNDYDINSIHLLREILHRETTRK